MTLDITKSYLGTCQCCFGEQVTKTKAGSQEILLVLHGYERPGVGYAVGNCRGYEKLPYELSCEATKGWLVEVRLWIALKEKSLALFVADKIDTLWIEVTDNTKPRDHLGRSETKSIQIGRDYKPEPPAAYYTDFRWWLKSKISNMEMELKMAKHDEARLVRRIADWKYAPEALKIHDAESRIVWHFEVEVHGNARQICNFRKHENLTTDVSKVNCSRCHRSLASIAKDKEKSEKAALKPVSKKQAVVLKRVVAAGGEEEINVTAEWEAYYAACDLEHRKMLTLEMSNHPAGYRVAKVVVTEAGRVALDRYVAAEAAKKTAKVLDSRAT